MTDEELTRRLCAAQRKVDGAEANRAARDAIVIAAFEAGWPERRIAETVGLTQQRVAQIRRGIR